MDIANYGLGEEGLAGQLSGKKQRDLPQRVDSIVFYYYFRQDLTGLTGSSWPAVGTQIRLAFDLNIYLPLPLTVA